MAMSKMKTLEGIARKHGRNAFLEAAKYYSCHVKDTVADTIYEMESRWYDRRNQITEAQAMIRDYNNCDCILTMPPSYAVVDMGQADRSLHL